MRRRTKGASRRHSIEATRRHRLSPEEAGRRWRQEEAELPQPDPQPQEEAPERVRLVGEGARETPPEAPAPQQPPQFEATGYEQIYRAVGRWGWPPSLFSFTLLFSLLFHLSMVTLFSIVILFPRQDLTYYQFSIVPDALRPAPPVEVGPDKLQLSALDKDLDQVLEKAPAIEAITPSVELPTLEFAELQRLRVRQDHPEGDLFYEAYFDSEPKDSWGRFGQGLRRFGQSLYGKEAAAGAALDPLEEPFRASPTHIPAEGFEAYIQWHGADKSRPLLFAPPIKALWEVAPQDLKQPIELVLKVNAHGRVVNVWSPSVDETGLVGKVQLAVLKYRFEPLRLEEGGEQTATLEIRAAHTGRGL